MSLQTDQLEAEPASPTIKPTGTQDSAWQRLLSIPLPTAELDAALDTLPPDELLSLLDTATSKINRWLEEAHFAVFYLEKSLKAADDSQIDHQTFDNTIRQIQPLMDKLVQVGDMVDEMEEDESTVGKRIAAKMALAKTQSEWSGLQHFMASVRKEMDELDEEKRLGMAMDQVLIQMDDISTMIFQYLERRHAKARSSKPSTPTPSSSSSSSSASTKKLPAEDAILAEIDSKVEPVFRTIESLYARMTSDRPPRDKLGILARKHVAVQGKWEQLRSEFDDLKYELKEDRWLTVFRQVADQVDVMIDGLDSTVAQCVAMVHQVRDWHTATHGGSAPQHSTVEGMPKGVLRHSSRTNLSNASMSASSSTGSAGYTAQCPVDLHKFLSAEKNLEAKYKYYTPSIDRMLSMLGQGIASRVSQDTATTRRHQAIVQRWQQLKSEMADLRIRDLPDTERLLMADRPLSPSTSRMSDRSDRSWRESGQFRSPEPSSQELLEFMSNIDLGFGFSTGTGTINGRAQSPHTNPLAKSGYSWATSPLGGYEEHKRGRSVTPSSSSGRELRQGTGASSPVYGRLTRTTSPLSFSQGMRSSSSDSSSMGSSAAIYGERKKAMTPTRPAWNPSAMTGTREVSSSDPLWRGNERSKDTLSGSVSGRRSVISPSERDQASWMRSTKNTLLRKQSREEMRQSSVHSKTPNPSRATYSLPNRPSSSLESLSRSQMATPDLERAASPGRRSVTPSLIPRPKTPAGLGNRALSPTQIPRPRSSMQVNHGYTTNMLQVSENNVLYRKAH